MYFIYFKCLYIFYIKNVYNSPINEETKLRCYECVLPGDMTGSAKGVYCMPVSVSLS